MGLRKTTYNGHDQLAEFQAVVAEYKNQALDRQESVVIRMNELEAENAALNKLLDLTGALS